MGHDTLYPTTLGEIHLPGSDLSLPALPGMEYPDPQGSGLTVPILGAQMDPVSGLTVPLAGTMEDPDGKGVLAPVVGVRLDVPRQTAVPVTASYCLALGDNTDSVLYTTLHVSVSVLLCLGDDKEWEQQCCWQTELVAGLDRVNVCVEKLQQDHERWTAQRGEQTASIHVMDGKLRQREIWEQLNSRQAELNAALIALHCVRELCQLRAETAQSVLSGSFWYKEFGLARPTVPSNPLKVVSLTQQKAVPLLERLIQLLEESKQPSFSPSTYCQRISVCVCDDVSHTEEEWDKLLELSPLFQLLKGVERKLRGLARDAGLLRGELDGRGTSFIDYLDAQWECEGELRLLDPDSLNPREFLVYQHGLFLLQTLHTLKLEAEQTVFVRRQRLQSVGGFSLLLLHCLSHIAVGDMSVDSSPTFQRAFFK
ncbi:unnamed protein product, partial [Coregonus sp. 'balchen']